jgi:poly[(R)-3-hydroxyalkanoate] polymerase subunit PhaC
VTASATTDGPPSPGARAAASAALEVLLTDAAVGGRTRLVQPRAAAGVIGSLARRPGVVARRAGGLAGELARVAAGRSDREPAKGDRRFSDRGWQENWLLRRLLQGYLAVGETVDELISDAEVDWQTERLARFAAVNVLGALAPSNFPLTNPAVLRETVDRGGVTPASRAPRLAGDMSRSPRLPASVDTTKFDVGANLASTPGAVVLRTDVLELIQYRPQTAEVRELPLLIVPPTINKYYVLDLAPGRSLVEHLLRQGQQVFIISWRNPDAEQSHFDLDTYAQAVLEARAAVAAITRQRAVHLLAACSGGIIAAGALGRLADAGDSGDAASLTLLVCALDTAQAGTAAALTSRESAAAAVAESARKGYLDGKALAGVFAWLRPNDLIWSYVVNNYLLGKEPPAFDVLYWNQDTVRLAAGMHRDFIRIALDNPLSRPGALDVLGSAVDLGLVEIDSYVVAGASDHIIPWEQAYRSSQLLGGCPRFVLSDSGHIQALVNPPGPESRRRYRVAPAGPPESELWLHQAVTRQGSWWPDYAGWLGERSGDFRRAPRTLGNRRHKALVAAPGTYVHAD